MRVVVLALLYVLIVVGTVSGHGKPDNPSDPPSKEVPHEPPSNVPDPSGPSRDPETCPQNLPECNQGK